MGADIKVRERRALLPAAAAVGQVGLAGQEPCLIRQRLASEVVGRNGLVEIFDPVEATTETSAYTIGLITN